MPKEKKEKAYAPPRTSSRNKTQTVFNPEGQVWDLMDTGYTNFKAQEVGPNEGDGTQSCDATLYYLPAGAGGGVWSNAKGSTADHNGHAEMAAIFNFWVNVCQENYATFSGATKRIECTSKPCCVRCSAILGLLLIARQSTATKKTSYTMGGTQWVLVEKLRQLLALATGKPATIFNHCHEYKGVNKKPRPKANRKLKDD